MQTYEVDDVLDLCDDIMDLCDDMPDSEAADDFKESVMEKVVSIRQHVEDLERFSDKQLQTLLNIKEGVSKWIR